MNKILLIAQREYLTRVRKKLFAAMIILTPLLFMALLSVPVWLQRSNVVVETQQVEPQQMKQAFGMIASNIICVFIMLYSTQVMRSVVEEKTSRVVEIIVSSVKPFELMLGKIIGITLVALTQFAIWAAFFGTLFFVFGHGAINALALPEIPVVAMLICFLVYFVGGYLLYASLFAAVGAASGSETDTQQFVFPLVLPIVFPMYAGIYISGNPNSDLAFWSSLVPFTSPFVMLMRLPFGVPAWQLVLSVGVLFASFTGITWIAAKVYRTGILMYGKKTTYTELWKWIKQK